MEINTLLTEFLFSRY